MPDDTRLFNWRALVRSLAQLDPTPLTPRRYLSWPNRSRYRRQNGRVPKFLLITFNKFFADDSRSGTGVAFGTNA